MASTEFRAQAAELAEETITIVIASATDDAEEFIAPVNPSYPAGAVQVGSSDLDLTFDTAFSVEVVVGLRFANVAIPDGAVVTSAAITFTRHTAGAGTVTLTIVGQDLDDAATFSDDGDLPPSFGISGRARTRASVDWVSAAAWDETETTPNLASIVQEIVDRDGWRSGNALAFTIASADSDADNYRRARSFESGGPAVLSITYTVSEPAVDEPADPEPVEPEPADPERVEPEPIAPPPADPSPAPPEPAPPDAEHDDATRRESPRERRFQFEPVGGSGVRGTLVMSDLGGGTGIAIRLESLPPEPVMFRIRPGTCTRLGPVLTELLVIEADEQAAELSIGVSAVALRLGRFNVEGISMRTGASLTCASLLD